MRRNIQAIAKLEEEFIRNRTFGERVADLIGSFAGSMSFVGLHVVLYTLWIVINLGLVPGIRPFDPYPFMLLNMSVSLEAIFLSTFVLIKQNRMSRRADQRENLDLQVNLLAEREMTLVLQMLKRISTRLEIHFSNEDLDELTEETSVEALASELKEQLPEE
ncbi:MAG TPA: DUF1003 domain-containing protein [Bryobacteraceae bacterium]